MIIYVHESFKESINYHWGNVVENKSNELKNKQRNLFTESFINFLCVNIVNPISKKKFCILFGGLR